VVERDIYIRRASEVLGVSPDAMKSDVERIRRKKDRERKNKETNDALLGAKHIGDRVNNDAAKNIRANAAEEGLLGLLLIFEEYRKEAARDRSIISAEDFTTSLGRKIFEVIIDLENSEQGYSSALLSQFFTLDELGRIQKIERDRRNLARNDRDVFLEFAENVKKEKLQSASAGSLADEIAKKRELLKKAKEKNKNT
jgi:hypothetical protein